ncbi:glycosyltransferase [Qipengyuania sp. NPDC077410]|uniref:glycosyltransferase n=1 Tax=Qipengyuania sp. NPDC077410 TaxID=3364496 RepID=UPI0037CC8153
MTNRTDAEILLVTSHYPFGLVQENWIAPELEEFSRSFSKVHVLPVKELDGRRELPEGVELWDPIARLNRKAFFARECMRPSTWRHFWGSAKECHVKSKLNLKRLILCLKFACYRSAFEKLPRLSEFLASPNPKIVYAYWGHIPALSIPIAKASGSATCVRYHAADLYLHRPETGGFYPWRELVHSAADLLVFISDHGLEYFKRRYGRQSNPRAEVFRLGCRDFGPARQRAVMDPDRPVVMASASWLAPVKRVEEIATLAGELANRRPIVWHHFGGGHSDLVQEAADNARTKGAKVIFHGIVPVEKLQRFYRTTDIDFFVNLSRDEGVPVSIMEAMNADIPIVATNVGGTCEAVIEGRSGLLLDPTLQGRHAEVSEEILEHLSAGGILGASTPRQTWEELYNAEQLAKVFVERLLNEATQASCKKRTFALRAKD